MRAEEFNQLVHEKSPAMIYQCYCTEITNNPEPDQSNNFNFTTIKKWFFEKFTNLSLLSKFSR